MSTKRIRGFRLVSVSCESALNRNQRSPLKSIGCSRAIAPEQRSVIISEEWAGYERKRAGAHLRSLKGNDL